jgi:hypothetical protein
MANYESDHTAFMREWLAKNPQEVEVQKAGRALWWDKGPRDEQTVARLAAARVPRKAYYYDAN